MSAITVDGELVHYEKLGRSGRPVVLVHGWIGSWRYWIPVMQHLHMRYRVYALDLFGYGDSGKNPAKYTLQQQVGMLEEFMDQLGINKAAFIGHGLGAMIVAEFAFRHQMNRVPRAMLISTPLFDTGNLDKRPPSRQPDFGMADDDMDRTLPSSSMEATIPSAGMMRQALLERAAMQNRFRGRSLPGSDMDDDDINVAGNPLAQSIATTSLSEMLDRCFRRTEAEYDKLKADLPPNTDERVLMKSIAEYDARKMLATVQQLKMPTMFVHGDQDPILTPPGNAVWDFVTADMGQKVALTVEGVRHFPMLENERFGRFVLDFLEARDITDIEGIKGRWQRRSR